MSEAPAAPAPAPVVPAAPPAAPAVLPPVAPGVNWPLLLFLAGIAVAVFVLARRERRKVDVE